MEEQEYTAQEFIEDFYKIKDKEKNLVNLKFNTAQQKVYDVIKRDYGNKPVRIIVLKARQLGISTLTEAIVTYFATNQPNTDAVILAHTRESAGKIYEMAQLYISELPEGLRPKQKYSNKQMLMFDNEQGTGLKSSVRVMMANESTRGGTYNIAHLSEVAFWEHPDEALLAVKQAIPRTNNSIIIIESTANGFNEFYNLWQDAVNGRSDYVPLFFPWYMDKDYTMPYRGFELTQYEKEIKEKFNLTNDQLQWRRYCIANDCGNDEMKFRQEYPITPEEAFITSGTSVFNTELVLEHMKNLIEPIKIGYFKYDYDGMNITNIRWVDDRLGYIKIYKEPNGPAVIGGDTAGEGSDFFVGQVLDRDGFLCATMHHQFDTDLYTKQMFCLGQYYGNATIAIESNFDTYPNLELQRLRYSNLFVRKKYDQIMSDVQDKFGFRTTSITRPLIISQLVEVVREDIEKIQDRETLQEMLSFVRINGKPQASEGTHDDLVMALAIAYEALSQLPKSNKPVIDARRETYDSEKEFIMYGI